MSKYIGFYDKALKEFYFSTDAKALSGEVEIDALLIRTGRDKVIDTVEFVLGPAELIKSNRGGGKGGSPGNFKKKEGEVF